MLSPLRKRPFHSPVLVFRSAFLNLIFLHAALFNGIVCEIALSQEALAQSASGCKFASGTYIAQAASTEPQLQSAAEAAAASDGGASDAAASAAADEELKPKALANMAARDVMAEIPSIRARLQRDHRIRLVDVDVNGQTRTHVYSFLSEQQLPYVISLGQFSIVTADGKTEWKGQKENFSVGRMLTPDLPFKKKADPAQPKTQFADEKEKPGGGFSVKKMLTPKMPDPFIGFKLLKGAANAAKSNSESEDFSVVRMLTPELPKLPFNKKDEKKPEFDAKAQSLAILAPPKSAQGLQAVDELGMILPPPGMQPSGLVDKSDLSNVVGFDAIGDGNNLEAAEKQFDQASKGTPDARFHNNYGALLAYRGVYDEASKHFDEAIKLNPNFAAALTNRALLSLAIGHPELAIDDARKALAVEPLSVPAVIAYGRSAMESKNLDEALLVAESMKEKFPQEWQTKVFQADVYLAGQKYYEANAVLQQLTTLSPSNTDLLLKRAHAIDKLGNLDEAIVLARKATGLAPDDPRTHITLGRYLESNRDMKAAQLQYLRAMELTPSRALRQEAMGPLLRVMVLLEKTDEGYELSKQWVKKFPDDAEVHYNKAWITSQLPQPKYNEAIEDYRNALKLNSNMNDARYNMALLLVKAGKKALAIEELKSFVNFAPNDKDSESARKLIQKLSGNG